MALHTIVYMNGDTRQKRQFSAENKPQLQDLIERQIRKLGIHAFDGATLGRPEEGEPHVTISFVEGAPENYCWEITDNRDPYWHLRHNQDHYVTCLPMEEAFYQFVTLALEFADHSNEWSEGTWS